MAVDDETAPPEREHRFLSFKPRSPTVARELALYLANHYAQSKRSWKEWRKVKPYQIEWEMRRPRQGEVDLTVNCKSSLMHPKTLADMLERNGRLDYEELLLPELQSAWLDQSTPITFIAKGGPEKAATKLPPYAYTPSIGGSFKVQPFIDRDGSMFNSFQRAMLVRLLLLRTRLVEGSNTFQADDWLEDLRALFSAAVSALDITLHQLYFKAKHDPLPGWTSDASVLGPTFGSRMSDKIKWVHTITRRPLNARDAWGAFKRIKQLRNHLQHFDPPCFAFTMDEVAAWLNDVRDVGVLLRAIRECVDAPLSGPLIELLVAPDVEYTPAWPYDTKASRDPYAGYKSSCEPRQTALPDPTVVFTATPLDRLLPPK